MLKKHTYIHLVLLLIMVCSCRLTQKLENTDYRPQVNQPGKVTKNADTDIKEESVVKEADGNSDEQIRTRDEKTGEDIVTVALSEVTVVARTKTVPERFGMVNLDFVVTVPKTLIDKRWMIILTPTLEKSGEKIELEDVAINGEIYRLFQEKGEAMYSTLADRYNFFTRDTTRIWDYFYRKYNLQYNTDARLDTVISAGNNFNYYYTQEVATDESKSMDLYLTGNIFALDKSTYTLPQSDTITYFVSSMIQFLDNAPRFKRRIIERHAEANFSAHITFPVGRENIDENLNDNANEIAKVQDIIKQLTWSNEFIIDSINMTASASPEGSWRLNEALAKRRAISLKSYFGRKLDDKKGVDTLFNAKWIAEDWKRVYDLIAMDNHISSKDAILQIITNEADPDKRELQIKNKFPVEYKHIRDSIYPALRVVDFQFNLHRSGMTQDTIHTTEPDTLYEKGRDLLKARKYKDALAILIEYGDYNTAIAYMSLGYDKPAYDILLKEKESANQEYLLAILCSRLKREEEAVRRFLHSCELDGSKVYRGALDPEINRLIRKYNLNKKIDEL
ncbi:hypothetical protein [Bacteroides faecis]|uniref:hypothetical protein n=1 Tax=Bacteroides faecis TaxID=674529 RepID=UPI00101F17CC|nr:hypothetical protein [Bacteroides faecis]KAA5263707.1 hypothetical protein F2Z41_22150 [Bacteroides faecis]MCE9012124.1 hypothetical protein [Bacteroides faecis]